MTSFWSRTKRRAVAVLAAGAASAATAYCVYTWYTSSLNVEPSPPQEPEEEEDQQTAFAAAIEHQQEIEENKFEEEIQLESLESTTPDNEEGRLSSSISRRQQKQEQQQPPPPVLIDPTGGTNTAALDAGAHLQHHFDSIQQIADATTLPSLLPALARALAAADGIDASLEKLRLAKGGSISLSPDEKQNLWNDLSGAALGRLTAAIWSLSLLSLQVRVQLNVLGRHLYLEAALHDPTASGAAGSLLSVGAGGRYFLRPPPQLSAPSQESFLSFSEYLTNVGHAKLLAVTRKAADAALIGVSLDQELNSEELGHILSRALALFTQEIIVGSGNCSGWIEFLLPPPQELRDVLRVKKPDDRAMLPGAHELLVDVDAVHAMVEEVGCILSSERFQEVLLLAARHVSKLAAAGLHERLGQGISLPLARLVPLIIAEAKSTLTARGEAAANIATLPEVSALCATVYSCGPPL